MLLNYSCKVSIIPPKPQYLKIMILIGASPLPPPKEGEGVKCGLVDHRNTRTSTSFCNDWTSGLLDFFSVMTGLPDFWTSGLLLCNDWTSGLLDFFSVMTGLPDFWTSGLLAI
jgi:hypothetical protein